MASPQAMPEQLLCREPNGVFLPMDALSLPRRGEYFAVVGEFRSV
jgi:hypothetical protein